MDQRVRGWLRGGVNEEGCEGGLIVCGWWVTFTLPIAFIRFLPFGLREKSSGCVERVG